MSMMLDHRYKTDDSSGTQMQSLCFKATSLWELERVAFVKLNSSIQHTNELNIKTNPTKSSFIQFGFWQTISDIRVAGR